jgi:hypothetical protein
VKIADTVKGIIGKDSFARLKKRGLHTGAAIKRTNPEELMRIAGIGPKKTVDLYKALGVGLDESKVERAYRGIKDKTKFKRIRSRFNEFIEDPKKPIEAIESKRQELIAWHNLLATTRNIGRPREQRIQELTYVPVGLTLDPFSIDAPGKAKDEVYAEVFITPEFERGKIAYSVREIKNGDLLLNENEFFIPKGSVETASNITDVIADIYSRFRKRTLTGRFFIVLDKSYNSLFHGIKQKFVNEIERGRIFIIDSFEEYFGWEALFKYNGNVAFERMIERLDDYHAYFLHERYANSGGQIEFDKWKSESEEYSDLKFWKFTENETLSQQKSHIVVRQSGKDNDILFGLLKGMPDAFDFEKSWKLLDVQLPLLRDTGYIGFKETRRELPVEIGGLKVPAVVVAFANAVLDRFKVFKDKSKIIFQSIELPEVGILFVKR